MAYPCTITTGERPTMFPRSWPNIWSRPGTPQSRCVWGSVPRGLGTTIAAVLNFGAPEARVISPPTSNHYNVGRECLYPVVEPTGPQPASLLVAGLQF